MTKEEIQELVDQGYRGLSNRHRIIARLPTLVNAYRALFDVDAKLAMSFLDNFLESCEQQYLRCYDPPYRQELSAEDYATFKELATSAYEEQRDRRRDAFLRCSRCEEWEAEMQVREKRLVASNRATHEAIQHGTEQRTRADLAELATNEAKAEVERLREVVAGTLHGAMASDDDRRQWVRDCLIRGFVPSKSLDKIFADLRKAKEDEELAHQAARAARKDLEQIKQRREALEIGERIHKRISALLKESQDQGVQMAWAVLLPLLADDARHEGGSRIAELCKEKASQ